MLSLQKRSRVTATLWNCRASCCARLWSESGGRVLLLRCEPGQCCPVLLALLQLWRDVCLLALRTLHCGALSLLLQEELVLTVLLLKLLKALCRLTARNPKVYDSVPR